MNNRRYRVSFLSAILLLFGFAGPLLAQEDYVHTYTGFTFPPTIGDFARAKVTPFNKEKSDIEVDYNNDPYTVHLSVYVYPATGTLQDHYKQCCADVMKVHPDAKLLSDKPVTIVKSGVSYDGYNADYSFSGTFVSRDKKDLLSRLTLYRRGDYYILYRISYLAADQSNAERQISEFLRQQVWPPGTGTAPTSQ